MSRSLENGELVEYYFFLLKIVKYQCEFTIKLLYVEGWWMEPGKPLVFRGHTVSLVKKDMQPGGQRVFF